MRRLSVLFTLAVALCAPPLIAAQDEPLPPGDPRLQVFGGYSGYRAGGKVNNVTVPDFTMGWAGQFIFHTTHWAAIVADINGHNNSSASAYDLAFGLRLQRPMWRFIPFAEGTLGVQHFSPKGLPSQNAPTYIAGAGLDVKINRSFSFRPFELAFVNSVYTANQSSNSTKNYFNGYRAQAGVIYTLGLPSLQGPVQALCASEPKTVDAGEPVKVTVISSGFLPKRTISYSYGSTGGSVAGNLATATVDTTGVQAGTYTVTANVADNGKRKHRQTTSCETAFTVKAKLPPTLSVSADPTSVLPGDASKITARGNSPDNRPLSYTCSASAGHLNGSGPAYTLETTGAPEGKITVTCTVSDDRSLSASASADVEVAVRTGATPPAAKFGTIEFMHDAKRPSRVDNQAKGELDRFADALAAALDAKAVVVGYASAAESKNSSLADVAALRAVNTKDYLKQDKGIDPARIEPRTGTGDGQKAELWLVPAGSTFSSEGSTVVDESKVKAVPRVALKPHAHKKARRHPKKHKAR